ncbi:MAG: C2 domain-containing protein [Hydrococcus sp. Prado102]|nr:C2 domain-containing protein [Hydrococcus sp. Prado102]
MAKIFLGKLKCWKTTSGGGADDVYAKFFVDGRSVGRWPYSGDCDMNVGSEVFINQAFEFSREFQIELWEYDSTSSDDFMGAHTFYASGSGSGTVWLTNPKEGNNHELSYEYLGSRVKVVTLHSAKCVAMSESLNSSLISQAMGLTSSVVSVAGSILSNIPKPPAQLVGQALNAGAAVFNQIPGLAQAIADSGNYPDQLYMTFTNQPGVDKRFWPLPAKYYEILPGQIVRFDNLRYSLSESRDITLWEYDSGSGDDHLGSFAIEKDIAEGNYVTTVTSSSEGSIYLVAYTVAQEELMKYESWSENISSQENGEYEERGNDIIRNGVYTNLEQELELTMVLKPQNIFFRKSRSS